MLDRRAICEVCGHTREWHDRDFARARLRAEPPIDRPCYRETGGAACQCGGFRESGQVAMPVGSAGPASRPTPPALVRNGLLTLVLVVMGLAMLYAYRSQTPAIPTVPVSVAVEQIQAGRIRSVTIAGTRATLEFRDSSAHREETFVSAPDTVLSRAVADYNAAHPGDAIVLVFAPETQPLVAWVRSS